MREGSLSGSGSSGGGAAAFESGSFSGGEGSGFCDWVVVLRGWSEGEWRGSAIVALGGVVEVAGGAEAESEVVVGFFFFLETLFPGFEPFKRRGPGLEDIVRGGGVMECSGGRSEGMPR